MRYEVALDERSLRVELTPEGRFTVDDRAVAADVREIVRGRVWSITLDGESHEVTVLTYEPLRVDIDGLEVRAAVVDERTLRARGGAARSRSGRVEIRAPMPGLLKAVHVVEGDVVDEHAPIVTLEAMKMENELLAPIRGRVTKVTQTAGTKVDGGAVLAILVAV